MKNNKGEVNNRNEPPKADGTGAKTSGINSVLVSKEEIKNYIWKSVIKGYGFETCNNYDCKTRISPTIIVYLAFVPLSRHFR